MLLGTLISTALSAQDFPCGLPRRGGLLSIVVTEFEFGAGRELLGVDLSDRKQREIAESVRKLLADRVNCIGDLRFLDWEASATGEARLKATLEGERGQIKNRIYVSFAVWVGTVKYPLHGFNQVIYTQFQEPNRNTLQARIKRRLERQLGREENEELPRKVAAFRKELATTAGRWVPVVRGERFVPSPGSQVCLPDLDFKAFETGAETRLRISLIPVSSGDEVEIDLKTLLPPCRPRAVRGVVTGGRIDGRPIEARDALLRLLKSPGTVYIEEYKWRYTGTLQEKAPAPKGKAGP